MELGPGTALSRVLSNRLKRVETRSVDELRDVAAVAAERREAYRTQRSLDRR
jgi:hypothetical protein